jgi:hypothetical protein
LLNNGRWDGKGKGEQWKGLNLTKGKYSHSGDTSRNPFEHWLRN